MFGIEIGMLSVGCGILVGRLLWLAGIGTFEGGRRYAKERVIDEALRVVEDYEAYLSNATKQGS